MRFSAWSRVLLPIAAAALLAAAACNSTSTPEITPSGDRFDSTRRLINEALREGAPSIAIAAAQDGRIVWEEAFGWADRGNGTAATAHSVYALASISKSFTATGLMILVERGLVDLDRPVNDYLGEAKLTPFAGDPTGPTVRQVLQFTSGLPTHVNIFVGDDRRLRPDQDESIRRYGIVVDEPGREYVYSNFGYGVLDRVISKVSGRSYAEFMQSEVFEPLGLEHTAVFPDPALKAQTATLYDRRGNPMPPIDFDHRGASAVRACVHDLIRWGLFHLEQRPPGQRRILSDEAIDRLHRPSEFDVPGEGIGRVRMGLGLAVVDMEGIRFLIASGGMPGCTARLALIPAYNVAVATLMNGESGEAHDLWRIEWETFRALLPNFPEAPEIPAAEQAAGEIPQELDGSWSGSVRTDQGDLPARLSIQDQSITALEIGGTRSRPIQIRNPLGQPSFHGLILEAPFFGSLATDEARRAHHVLFLRVRRQDDRLTGVVSAVALNRTFWLPYWIDLKRER